jgi:TctA family transporter
MHRLNKLIAFATVASYALVALIVWFVYDKTLLNNHYMAVAFLSILPVILDSKRVNDAIVALFFAGLSANLLLLVCEGVNLIITPDTLLIFIGFYGIANLLYSAAWVVATLRQRHHHKRQPKAESQSLAN